MTVDETSRSRIEYEQRKWLPFLFLGFVLFAGGVLALYVPSVSTYASSVVLGVVLMGIGIVKIVQSLAVKSWAGFVWQELTGVLELIGGIMVYLNPAKGALAVTFLIAVVIFVHGVLQIGMSIKVRRTSGWYWFTISGIIAICTSAALIFKLPYTRDFPPGAVAGVALMIAGLAYVAIALSVRKAVSWT
jgi:uncharacterized membrane protein HdeD (DUF308 family)